MRVTFLIAAALFLGLAICAPQFISVTPHPGPAAANYTTTVLSGVSTVIITTDISMPTPNATVSHSPTTANRIAPECTHSGLSQHCLPLVTLSSSADASINQTVQRIQTFLWIFAVGLTLFLLATGRVLALPILLLLLVARAEAQHSTVTPTSLTPTPTSITAVQDSITVVMPGATTVVPSVKLEWPGGLCSSSGWDVVCPSPTLQAESAGSRAMTPALLPFALSTLMGSFVGSNKQHGLSLLLGLAAFATSGVLASDYPGPPSSMISSTEITTVAPSTKTVFVEPATIAQKDQCYYTLSGLLYPSPCPVVTVYQPAPPPQQTGICTANGLVMPCQDVNRPHSGTSLLKLTLVPGVLYCALAAFAFSLRDYRKAALLILLVAGYAHFHGVYAAATTTSDVALPTTTEIGHQGNQHDSTAAPEKRCVLCPDLTPSCQACPAGQICSLVPQTCAECAKTECIPDPGNPMSPHSAAGALRPNPRLVIDAIAVATILGGVQHGAVWAVGPLLAAGLVYAENNSTVGGSQRCVGCPGPAPSCGPCPVGEVCQFTYGTCESCASAQCVVDPHPTLGENGAGRSSGSPSSYLLANILAGAVMLRVAHPWRGSLEALLPLAHAVVADAVDVNTQGKELDEHAKGLTPNPGCTWSENAASLESCSLPAESKPALDPAYGHNNNNNNNDAAAVRPTLSLILDAVTTYLFVAAFMRFGLGAFLASAGAANMVEAAGGQTSVALPGLAVNTTAYTTVTHTRIIFLPNPSLPFTPTVTEYIAQCTPFCAQVNQQGQCVKIEGCKNVVATSQARSDDTWAINFLTLVVVSMLLGFLVARLH